MKKGRGDLQVNGALYTYLHTRSKKARRGWGRYMHSERDLPPPTEPPETRNHAPHALFIGCAVPPKGGHVQGGRNSYLRLLASNEYITYAHLLNGS